MKKLLLCYMLILAVLCGCSKSSKNETNSDIYNTSEQPTEETIGDEGQEIIEYEPTEYDETNWYDSYNSGTSSGFVPYKLKVKNPSLNVYDGPASVYNVIDKITDKGTYTIVEEQIGILSRKWGRIEGKGWIMIDSAISEETSKPSKSKSSVETYESDETVDSIESYESDVQKSTTTKSNNQKPSETQSQTIEYGTLIKGLENRYIYGCGSEHTLVLNGVKFHWYDRYEYRNIKNTEVIRYMDIISFPLEFHPAETRTTSTVSGVDNLYTVTKTQTYTISAYYEISELRVNVSAGGKAHLGFSIYDKDNVYLEREVFAPTIEQNFKCINCCVSRGYKSDAKYAELSPWIT